MPRPTFLSTFAGIGGFDLGLERAGWGCVGQVEVNDYCSRVLARHWPGVRRWGDIRHLTFAPPAGEQLDQRPDLLVGGFPCQDLSSAGRRAGIAAARSGLFFQLVRLAAELQPAWLLLENVDELLVSRGGADFAAVLGALDELGYGVAWRVLDAQWFGLAQRRARVFLVGRLGAPCPAEVLFEPEGLPGHPAPGGAAPTDAVGTLGGRSPGGGWRVGADEAAAGHVVPSGSVWSLHGDALARSGQARTPSADAEGRVRLRNPGLGIRADQSFTLNASSPHAVAFNHTQDPVNSPSVSPTLGSDGMGVAQDAVPRRLTPTEYERLQGLPDGWTCVCGVEPYSTWTCRCPAGPRYEAGGNAVAVPVVEWIGRRIIRTL